MDKEKNEFFDESDIKPRKGLMIFLIIIALVIVVLLANKVITNHENNKKNKNSFFENAEKLINKGTSDIEKKSFNGKYELFSGTQDGDEVKSLLDDVIKNNKTNEKKISVVYNEQNTSDPEIIKNIKTSITGMKSYEVSLDYDTDGYINKLTIEKSRNKDDASLFNSSYEMYQGTEIGASAGRLLDEVVTNNKTNEDLITVSYNGTVTSNVNEIANIKSKLDDWTKYEITFDYDEYGYIKQVNIK